MPMIALKIDVDTYRGTCEGVPRLMDVLQRYQAGATFLWSLGPDHTGRAIRRVLRPGFLRKVARTSVLEHYGWQTLCYGTLLPGPDIGRRCAPLLRAARDAGFEMGVHCWDHIRWQDYVVAQDAAWTRAEMTRAAERFTEIFHTPPHTHGAAGWQMNEAAYRIERELGFLYASDCRAAAPAFPPAGVHRAPGGLDRSPVDTLRAFQPVDAQGEKIGVPQLLGTLPTLDELIGWEGRTADNVHLALLALTDPARGQRTGHPPSPSPSAAIGHVYTLHAELEGMKLLPVFERLLAGWRAQGYRLVACQHYLATLPTPFPQRCPGMQTIPGRSGQVAACSAGRGKA